MACLLPLGGARAGGAAPAPSSTGTWPPSGPATSGYFFLARYERPSGRVVRLDQGGDTVSEGEAYAMLVAVALGDRHHFAAAWSWTRTHLGRPDGLLAWHWSDGHVTDPEPATDADLDAAWALALAGRRFSDPAYLSAAARLSEAVLANETETYLGAVTTVAGPWAVGPAPVLNPSYDAPVDMAALSGLGGASAEWSTVAGTDRHEMQELLQGGHLPSDWAILDANGVAHPTSPPGRPGGPVVYGFDAVRVPVRLAASCDASDRALAVGVWRSLTRQVFGRSALVDLDLGGSPVRRLGADDPVGEVGAAAAAAAAGNRRAENLLLAEAVAANHRHPTYYGSAWVALARLLLQTGLLGGCGGRPADASTLGAVNPAAGAGR